MIGYGVTSVPRGRGERCMHENGGRGNGALSMGRELRIRNTGSSLHPGKRKRETLEDIHNYNKETTNGG